MKLKLILSFAAVTLLGFSGCKPNEQPAASGEPVPEVRGKAIAKLEPQPAPVPADPAVETPTNTTAKPLASGTASPTEKTNAFDIVLPEVDPKTVAKVPVPVPPKPETTNPAPAKVVANSKPPAPKADADGAAKTTEAESTELIDGEYAPVNFDKLAGFEYEVPDEEYDPDKKPDPKDQPDQIPATIKAFNKKRVALKGFMLPLKVEDGHITEMLIMRDQSMCCYGTVPKINEWVSVKMTGKGVKPIMDQAVTIFGRLKVGEIRENGYLVGIYEMDGEKLIGPLEF